MNKLDRFFEMISMKMQVKRWCKKLKIKKERVSAHLVSGEEIKKLLPPKNKAKKNGAFTLGLCITGKFDKDKRVNVSDVYYREGFVTSNNVAHELLHHKHPTWTEFRVRKNAYRLSREEFDVKHHREIIKKYY